MDQLLKDIRFGARTLLRSPAFALVAIVTLGLGIGANAAIFSVIDGVLLKPLPYASGERLLLIRQSAPLARRPDIGVSIKELYEYRAQTKVFDAIVDVFRKHKRVVPLLQPHVLPQPSLMPPRLPSVGQLGLQQLPP